LIYNNLLIDFLENANNVGEHLCEIRLIMVFFRILRRISGLSFSRENGKARKML
jgi:hypothetical protein